MVVAGSARWRGELLFSDEKSTTRLSRASTTCALVMMYPSGSTMKPEPRVCWRPIRACPCARAVPLPVPSHQNLHDAGETRFVRVSTNYRVDGEIVASAGLHSAREPVPQHDAPSSWQRIPNDSWSHQHNSPGDPDRFCSLRAKLAKPAPNLSVWGWTLPLM